MYVNGKTTFTMKNPSTRTTLRLASIGSLAAIAMANTASLHGQNLVLNPSFEDTVCTLTFGPLPAPYHGMHWYNANLGTGDLFVMDAPLPGCTIPWMNDPASAQYGGWQQAYDGSALAGLFCYHSMFCLREYLQVPLLEPLTAGVKYCVSFRLSLRDNSSFAIDRLGAHLSQVPVLDYGGTCTLNANAQVQSMPGLVLADTSGWMLVANDYIATGGESFLTIGNFTPDNAVNATLVNPSATNLAAYYFIDDVVVEACELSTGIANTLNDPAAWYDASNALLHLPQGESLDLRIFDAQGRAVHVRSLNGSVGAVDLSFLPKGHYVAALEGSLGAARVRIIR